MLQDMHAVQMIDADEISSAEIRYYAGIQPSVGEGNLESLQAPRDEGLILKIEGLTSVRLEERAINNTYQNDSMTNGVS